MEIRILAPTGALGAGFRVESLERGVALRPHVIACDAGSTDSGPAYLATGRSKYSREAVKDDLRLLMAARAKWNVPLLIGSCGTSGCDAALDWTRDIALEIDSWPDRQDLDVESLHAVAAAGCRVAIDTDAHAAHELAFVEFGIAAAIRAGIRRERVVNFLPRDELLAWSRARRSDLSRAI